MQNSKQLLLGILMGVAILIYGCGGNNAGDSSSEEPSTEVISEPEPVVDPEAKSDSKGVGRFTSLEISAIDKSVAKKGEVVFISKCSACHKATDEKVVGPGLKNVTLRREPEWIMNMITNPEEMTKKDPVAKALFEKHLVQMTFQNVSDEETRQILEFLRLNDSK